VKSRWSERFGAAAIVVLALTVSALPWLHGGVIPLARLVFVVGSATAGLLSLVSCVLRGDRSGFPPVLYPLAVLTGIAVFQLMPVHAPLMSQMNHAFNADLLPEVASGGSRELTVATGSPADTRLVLAQLIALMLTATVAFDQLRNRQIVMGCLTAISVNASAVSLAVIVQKFRGELYFINQDWWTGNGAPYGPFVNPNMAAGWLCMGLASAVGLLVLQIAGRYRESFYDPQPDAGIREAAAALVRHFAQLTAGQILTWAAIAVIGAGIATTVSRGGMMATIIAALALFVARLHWRQLPATLVVFVVGSSAILGLMYTLDLHRGALAELQTLYDPAGELRGRVEHWRDSL